MPILPILQDYFTQLAHLRAHLLRLVWLWIVVFLGFFVWRNALFVHLGAPLLHANQTLVTTQVTAPFLVPVYLAFVLSGFVVLPFVILEAARFLLPALHMHERRHFRVLAVGSLSAFYLGVITGYVWFLPRALVFMIRIAPPNLQVLVDAISLLHFSFGVLVSFGILFLVPVYVFWGCATGLVSPSVLVRYRRHIVVFYFFIAAIITPPDGASMLIFGTGLCFLHEVALWLARLKRAEQGIDGASHGH